METSSNDPEPLLSFWFGPDLDSAAAVGERSRAWFAANAAFDDAVRERFSDLPERAAGPLFARWSQAPRSALALVLALDQLPRNLYRGSRAAFDLDARALEAAESALARGFDARLHPVEAAFLYLPFEHAEDLPAQQRCTGLFESLLTRAPDALRADFERYLDYARRHHAVIERFGRFPHRNTVLGRASTPAESRFIAEGGDDFAGQARDPS